MDLLIDESAKQAVRTLYDGRLADLGIWPAGGVMPVTVSLLKRIGQRYDAKQFEPEDLTGWSIRAALGIGFVSPVAGNWAVAFTDQDDNQTLSDFSIPANPDAADIEAALNSLQAVTDVGGASVEGSNGFYQITFNVAGAVNVLLGMPSQLTPLSLLIFERSTQGDDDTQEVQTLRIVQNVGSIVSLTADAPDTISQANIVVGNGTHNAKIRVTLPANRYGGIWSLTKGATVVNNLGWGDSDAQLQQALQSALGSGTVLVNQVDEDDYDLTFAGSLGLQAIALTVDGSGLLVRQTFSGELDMESVGIQALLQNQLSTVLALEIEGAPDGGDNRKLLQMDVEVVSPIMRPESVEV